MVNIHIDVDIFIEKDFCKDDLILQVLIRNESIKIKKNNEEQLILCDIHFDHNCFS